MVVEMFKKLGEAQDLCDAWLKEWRGRVVRTPAGRYRGRPGRVTGAVLSSESRTMCVLVMVERADGSGPLNADADSRTYWKWEDFGDKGPFEIGDRHES